MEEGAFDFVDEEEVDGDNDDKEDKIKRGQRDETEGFSQRTEGKRNSNSDNTEGGNYEPFAWFAFIEGGFCCTYDKDDQGLSGKGFNEPACLKKMGRRMKNQEQHTVGKIIKNRA